MKIFCVCPFPLNVSKAWGLQPYFGWFWIYIWIRVEARPATYGRKEMPGSAQSNGRRRKLQGLTTEVEGTGKEYYIVFSIGAGRFWTIVVSPDPSRCHFFGATYFLRDLTRAQYCVVDIVCGILLRMLPRA